MYDVGMTQLYGQLQSLEPEDQPFTVEERLRAMNRPLLSWYKTNARILPWRENPEPYRVWISEVMLQQTRVEAVKPYFERFMETLPELKCLACVDDDRLMKLWEGLGYYNRARNLKKAACIVMEKYRGELPETYEELLKLPGIGSYTAGAIASIAFGQPVPAVDGNVLRVISRVTASYDDILRQSTKRRFESYLRETMPKQHASQFNQGLIEIGAIVCVPNGEPRCDVCPLESLCLAKKKRLIDQLPVKTPPKKRRIEKRTVCILQSGEQVAIRKRDGDGLLASLYELPNVEGWLKEEELAEAFALKPESILQIESLPEAKHIFSHVEWQMIGYRLKLEYLPKSFLKADQATLEKVYALPNAFGTYTKLIK